MRGSGEIVILNASLVFHSQDCTERLSQNNKKAQKQNKKLNKGRKERKKKVRKKEVKKEGSRLIKP